MKQEVDKQLSSIRNELLTLAHVGTVKSSLDKQKLLVSVVQDYIRHLNDGVRGACVYI